MSNKTGLDIIREWAEERLEECKKYNDHYGGSVCETLIDKITELQYRPVGDVEVYLEGKKHYAWEIKSHVSVVDTVTSIAALQALKEDCEGEMLGKLESLQERCKKEPDTYFTIEPLTNQMFLLCKTILDKERKETKRLTAEVERLKEDVEPSHHVQKTPPEDLIKNVISQSNPQP